MSLRRGDPADPHDWIHVDPTWPQRLGRRLFTRLGRWWIRYRAFGHQPRVPDDGGFLLAPAPHGAFSDPFIFWLGQSRARLRFMAKDAVFRWPIVGRIVRWGGGFPVQRGGGRSATALDVSRAVLESGDGVVVFMEGKLVLDHDGLGIPRNGVPRLALATGLPVVPAAAYGAKRPSAYGKHWWWHRPAVTVVWGEPISFAREADPTQERIDQVRDEIWARIGACFHEARERARHRGDDGYEYVADAPRPTLEPT